MLNRGPNFTSNTNNVKAPFYQSVFNRFINMIVLEGTFTGKKAEVGAYSVIAKLREGSIPAPAAAVFVRCQVGGTWPRLGFTRGMPAPAARTANIKRA